MWKIETCWNLILFQSWNLLKNKICNFTVVNGETVEDIDKIEAFQTDKFDYN